MRANQRLLSSGLRRIDTTNVYLVPTSLVLDELTLEYVRRRNPGVDRKIKVIGVRSARNAGDSTVLRNDDLSFLCVLDLFLRNGHLSLWVGSNVTMGAFGIGRTQRLARASINEDNRGASMFEVDQSEQSVADEVGTLKLVAFGIRGYNLLHRQGTVDACGIPVGGVEGNDTAGRDAVCERSEEVTLGTG